MDVDRKLLEVQIYFSKSSIYKDLVEKAIELHSEEKIEECEAILSSLPTEEVMMEELIEKLKGKSVYRNLKRITSGGEIDKHDLMKGLHSLATHIIIEIQHGAVEYRLLYDSVMKKLTDLSILTT